MTDSMPAPQLSLDLVLSQQRVHIRASRTNIDAATWYQIRLALADTTAGRDDHFEMTPLDLLERRLILRGLLIQHGISPAFDAHVTRLLASHAADREGYAQAQTAGLAEPTEQVGPGGEAETDVAPAAGHVAVPARIRLLLRDFQTRDLAKLQGLRHGANFSVPGAGKTAVTYALHAIESEVGRVSKMLVVAPLSAFSSWERDATEALDPPATIGRFETTIPDTDVVLINYHRLHQALATLLPWMLAHNVHLVVDEAHRAKRGSLGRWGSALLNLAPFAVRRDVLTGTPAPHHPKDMRTLLDILWPSTRASDIPTDALRVEPTDRSLRALSEHIAPLYVRTTKLELDLPRADIKVVPVPMGGLQADIYDALLDRYAGLLDLDRRDQAMLAQMGEVAIRLIQAASTPKLLSRAAPAGPYAYPSLAIPAGSRLADLLADYAQHEVAPKVELVSRMVHENSEADLKTLVWSNFPRNLEDLRDQFHALEPAVVHGGVSSSFENPPGGVVTREQEIARFRSEDSCRVLLANPAAMAEGISLHDVCHFAVYMDRTFNAGQYMQSLDRIHRLGLRPDQSTTVRILSSQGTIDERVTRRVARKSWSMAQMLNDDGLAQMSLPDEEDSGEDANLFDLEEVFRHLRDGRDGPNGG
jgi:SNF2 family DNA or RNA helicase